MLLVIGAAVPCCGLMAQQWVVFPELLPERMLIQHNMPVENGSSVLKVGCTHELNENFKTDGLVLKINRDGEVNFRTTHIPGMWLSYHCATQLENGNYIVFGVCDDSLAQLQNRHYLRVDVFDTLLEPVSSRQYRVNDTLFGFFREPLLHPSPMSSMLSDSGTVVLATSQCREVNGWMKSCLCFYEIDSNGNILRAEAPMEGNYPSFGYNIKCITRAPDTGDMQVFVGAGFFGEAQGGEGTGFKTVNADFEIVGARSLVKLSGQQWWIDLIDEIYSDGRWDPNGHMIVCAIMSHHNIGKPTFYFLRLYKIDALGNKLGELQLPPIDSCMGVPGLWNTAYVDDSTIFVLNHCGKTLYANEQQVNVTLVDNDLNLLGRKVFKQEGTILHCDLPAVFDDGGCVFALKSYEGNQWSTSFVKMAREDIEITWDVVPENSLKTSLRAYPNPTCEWLNIPARGIVGGATRLTITSIDGTPCVNAAVETDGDLITVNVRNLDAGIYVYQIVTNGKTNASGKFIKE